MNTFLQQISELPYVTSWIAALPRIAGLFVFFPLLGSAVFPPRTRVTCAFAVTLALGPALNPSLPEGGLSTLIPFGALEFGMGAMLGLGARILTSVAEAASSFVANQAGFAIASQVDPMSGDQSLVPATFTALIATALFFAADLHHLLIVSISSSFRFLPPSEVGFDSLLMASLPTLGKAFFGIALSIAAPALLLTIMSDLILVLAGKAMPQAPILMISFPVKLALGLIAIMILNTTVAGAVPLIADAIEATLADWLQA